MAVGAYGQALTLMDQVRDDLGDDLTAMSGPALSVYGSSHLRSAILAARATKTSGPGSRAAGMGPCRRGPAGRHAHGYRPQ